MPPFQFQIIRRSVCLVFFLTVFTPPLVALAQSQVLTPPISAGVLCSTGQPSKSTSQSLYVEVLRKAGMNARYITPEAVRDGLLGEFDVFIIGGGSGTGFVTMLQKEGCREVEAFIERGGGVLGSCAGSYAFSRGYNDVTSNLEIANARCLPASDGRLHRGTGVVKLMSCDDATLSVSMFYANGPVWEIEGATDKGGTWALARFETDIRRDGDTGGVMPGAPAVLGGTYGNGRFVLFSCHPEFWQHLGNHQYVSAAARWVTRGPLTSDESVNWEAVFGLETEDQLNRRQ